VTFTTPESFLLLPPWNASRSGSLSLKIRTTEGNGLILFAKNERQASVAFTD
jgi:neurexin